VSVYAGLDPLTGKRVYLSGSTTDPGEAKRMLNRLRAQVDQQRHAKSKATLRAAFEDWLEMHEIEQSTRVNYEGFLRLYVGPAIGDQPIGTISARVLEQLYADLRRCSQRCGGQPFIAHRVDGPHECRIVRHRRPPGRRPAAGYPPHDCAVTGCTVVECQPHRCRGLSSSTISKIHFVLSGVFAAAVRWGWIPNNPAAVARKPRQPTPQPRPPTPEQAARIINAAWEEGEAWGTLVWLVMATGLRRAEVLALRWSDVDLAAGKLYVRRNIIAVRGQRIEKDTKTHRMRRISLDPATVNVLGEHRERYESQIHQLGLQPTLQSDDPAYVFSYSATYDEPCGPDGVTHRYNKMCRKIGVDSHLHALRHYSATELLTAGVDLRTVAGRLGHGGGGATTLRVYAAWIDEFDQRAAEILGNLLSRS
jgi:integrase